MNITKTTTRIVASAMITSATLALAAGTASAGDDDEVHCIHVDWEAEYIEEADADALIEELQMYFDAAVVEHSEFDDGVVFAIPGLLNPDTPWLPQEIYEVIGEYEVVGCDF